MNRLEVAQHMRKVAETCTSDHFASIFPPKQWNEWAQLLEDADEEISALREDLLSFDVVLQDRERQIAGLEDQVGTLEFGENALRDQIKTRESEIAACANSNARLSNQIISLRAEISVLEETKRNLHANYERAVSKMRAGEST